jgi:8-oxo-dGTP pyrophosphatase MutT (NUDIX family)
VPDALDGRDQRRVRPRDAASLILLRQSGAGLEVLIGRRGHSARFMPGRYVFPGGRVAAEDAQPLPGETSDSDAPALLALKRAALRETFEETGLVVGEHRHDRAAPGDATPPLAAAYRRQGMVPAPALLRLVGRAITPASSPIRFHARFFLADGRHAAGELTPSEELDDLHWHAVGAEPPGTMQNVTRFMLRCALEAWRGTAPPVPPLYCHRGERTVVSHGRKPR